MQPIGTVLEKQTIREKENPEWRIDSGGWDPQMKKEREPGPPLLRGICTHLFNLILQLIFKGKKEQVHANRTGQKSPIQRGTFLRLGCWRKYSLLQSVHLYFKHLLDYGEMTPS